MHKIMKKNGKDVQLSENVKALNESAEFMLDPETSGVLLDQALCKYEKCIYDLAKLIGDALKDSPIRN
jgi:hypothetical protein